MYNNLLSPLTNYVIICACTKFCTLVLEVRSYRAISIKDKNNSVNIAYFNVCFGVPAFADFDVVVLKIKNYTN